MRRLTRIFPALLLVTVLLSACGATARASGPLPPEAERTRVRVENLNFLDMTVYVLRGSQRVRLGLVPGTSTQTFTIPANLVFGISSLRFVADPIGGRQTPISQEISVRPGDEVTLMIPNR